MKFVKLVPYASIGDNLLLIWLRREIETQLGLECRVHYLDNKDRQQNPNYPGKLWDCIMSIYKLNGIPFAKGTEDYIITKFYEAQKGISIYRKFLDIGMKFTGQELDFAKANFTNFLRTDETKAALACRSLGLDRNCILINQPSANVNNARRYVPLYVMERLLELLRIYFPGYKMVKIGSVGSVYRNLKYDIDLWGKMDLLQYYHASSILPQVGPIGGIVHLANGFGKEQVLVIYGGSEHPKWHWEDSMPFIPYIPNVQCDCFAFYSENCDRHPSCFENTYDLDLLEEKVKELARRTLWTPISL